MVLSSLLEIHCVRSLASGRLRNRHPQHGQAGWKPRLHRGGKVHRDMLGGRAERREWLNIVECAVTKRANRLVEQSLQQMKVTQQAVAVERLARNCQSNPPIVPMQSLPLAANDDRVRR